MSGYHEEQLYRHTTARLQKRSHNKYRGKVTPKYKKGMSLGVCIRKKNIPRRTQKQHANHKHFFNAQFTEEIWDQVRGRKFPKPGRVP